MAYYQQNMLSIKSRTLLASILAEVVLISESVESYREALANLPFFDCIALFRFIDKDQKGYIREKDLQRIIGTKHRKLLTYAFTWMDNLKVGEISRLQFVAFMLPKDNLNLRELIAERIEHPQISSSQDQTLLSQYNIFRELILSIIRQEMKIIELRRQLLSQNDYSIRGVLLAIDNNYHDWVCTEDIFKFMKNYGYDTNLRQIEKLVQIINFSMSGKVNQRQLVWTVQGFQGKDRSYLNKIKASNKKQFSRKIVNLDEVVQKFNKIAYISNPSEVDNSLRQYQILKSKFQNAQKEAMTIESDLLQYQKKVEEDNKKLLQQEIENIKAKKEFMTLQKQRQLEELQRQKILQNQLNDSIEKIYQMELATQKMKQQALNMSRKQQNQIVEKRLSKHYSTYSEYGNIAVDKYSRQKKYKYDIDAKPESNYEIDARIKYSNLTNLNNLSMVVSQRKPTVRNQQYNLISKSIKKQPNTFQNDSILIVEGLRNKIREERNIQKAIHEKFAQGSYDYGKFSKPFNSKVGRIQQIEDTKAFQRSSTYMSANKLNDIYKSPDKMMKMAGSMFKKNNTISTNKTNKLWTQK